jgi:dienelactone hydrolase
MHRALRCLFAALWLAASPFAALHAAEPFGGTQPLQVTGDGDFASQMVSGIDRFLLDQTAASVEQRARHWQRDLSSAAAYEASVAGNRGRLAKIIGAIDPRVKFDGLEFVSTTTHDALVGKGEGFEAFAVRWPVFRGVHGEGLLLKPVGRPPVARCIAIPDADQTPEMLAGLAEGVPAESQFARRLAESGCLVVVPALLDRADTYSITLAGIATNQPHREFIYRPAFEMGRHIIGYEVQKVLAVVDQLTRESGSGDAAAGDPAITVAGYGEGGLLALYAAALDPRIDATLVSGYFDSRQNLWQEPIYRNVFALLDEFGDAELASLVAPRPLVIEASAAPQVTGPPAPRDGRRGGAAPGRIVTPALADVQQELERAQALTAGLPGAAAVTLVPSGDGQGPFGSEAALAALLSSVAPDARVAAVAGTPTITRATDPQARLQRQVAELIEDTQHAMREGEYVRQAYWSQADRSSLDNFVETSKEYRHKFYDDVIGRFDMDLLPANPRSRQCLEHEKYTGYEVMLDVFPDVFAYGILILPKDLRPGERRPVVVCQHGLEGRPQDTIGEPGFQYYSAFATKLAERGFITYAPQNPYIFQDRFRTLQRKLNPLRKTLYSVIVPQHQQTVDWLASLPMVDADRIAFYGLSYGGKTAMRVPPLVDRYCLSICSADFNEWIWKNASLRAPFSYPATGEYEIFEFDLGNTFNYAEMAALIAPRPFMVERGHHDGVGIDEWVNYEYAKVRKLYSDLKIPELTTIEHFDGPHKINGVGTYEFLHHHLNWPAPESP